MEGGVCLSEILKAANFSESSITRINLWGDLVSRENIVTGIWYTLYFIYTKGWETNASLWESIFPKKLKGITQRDSWLCLRTLDFCFHFCHCPTKNIPSFIMFFNEDNSFPFLGKNALKYPDYLTSTIHILTLGFLSLPKRSQKQAFKYFSYNTPAGD